MKKKSFKDNPALQFISAIHEEKEQVKEKKQKSVNSTTKDKSFSENKGKHKDTKEKTAKRMELNAKKLEEIRLYSLTEIEPILGVTHRTLLTYMKTGRLKGIKVGGKWKVSEENLRKFINGED